MATEFISNSWLMPTNANAEANRVSNYSLTFDGSSQYIDCGQNRSFDTGDLSVSIWIYKDSDGSGTQYVFNNNNGSNIAGFAFVINNANQIFVGRRTRTYKANTGWKNISFTEDVWHHLCFTYNDTTKAFELYFNGNSVHTSTGTIYTNGPSQNITIGTNSGLTGLSFYGKTTEVSIFDYALTASQVTQLYGTGSAIGNPMAITNGRKPVAYYPLGNSAFNGEFLASNGAEQDYVFNFKRISSASNGRVNINNALSFTNKISVSIWFNYPTTASTNTQYIIAQDNGSSDRRWILGFNTSNKVWAGIYNTDNSVNYAIGTTTVKDSKWHQVVLIYDGTNNTNGIKIFLDGKLEAQQTASSTGLHTGSTLMTTIGNGSTASQYAPLFDCNLSNAQLWDTDLTYGTPTSLGDVASGEVATLYNYGTPYKGTQPQSANLQGWWELDASATFDGSNWSIPDASSNSNTGTSSGMTAANLILSDLVINQPFDSFALELDGTDDYFTIPATSTLQITGDLSFSCWFKSSDSSIQFMINLPGGNGTRMWLSSNEVRVSQDVGGAYRQVESGGTYTDGNWHLATGVMNTTSGFMGIYIDGVLKDSRTDATGTRTTANSDNFIGSQNATPTYPFNGSISNISIHNSALTAAQVQTLYNEGKPFDLNTFAVTPVSWWRLGSVNSSYNSTTSEWTVLDEIGTNNGTGSNLGPAQTALSDGVGATGSGLSSGMSSGTNRTGDAPYSESNAVSYNMSVTAKSTSVPT